jgi:hypothetical protein
LDDVYHEAKEIADHEDQGRGVNLFLALAWFGPLAASSGLGSNFERLG